MVLESFPDREITIAHKKYLYFGGTAYLGLPTHAGFQEMLFQNTQKWGTFYGSSRSSNIQLSVYQRAEELFAKQFDAAASLAVSSGTLAGRLVVDFLSKSIKSFYHYPKTHPAVLGQNSRELFVQGELHPNLQDTVVEGVVITVDAILALEVQPTSFEFLKGISSSKNITLVLDESHSLGIVGEKGQGIFNTISGENIYRKILVSSLGKGLGLSGGIIASDKFFVDALKKEAAFISASGANASHLETYIQAQEIYRAQQDKLQYNLRFLHTELKENTNLKYVKDYPVMYSDDKNTYGYLLKKGIVITHFKYPNYNGMMSRIVITANHTKADLRKLASALNKSF